MRNLMFNVKKNKQHSCNLTKGEIYYLPKGFLQHKQLLIWAFPRSDTKNIQSKPLQQ